MVSWGKYGFFKEPSESFMDIVWEDFRNSPKIVPPGAKPIRKVVRCIYFEVKKPGVFMKWILIGEGMVPCCHIIPIVEVLKWMILDQLFVA